MSEQRIFYIGDLHFGHEKILWLDNRPFKTIDEMRETLIRNWQDTVTDDDIVFVLGDMFWKTVPDIERKRIMDRLPGEKILIAGNHDAGFTAGWAAIYEAHEFMDGEDRVYMSHYPAVSFPGFYKNGVHLYAHTHIAFETNIAEHVKSVLEDLYLKPCRMYNVGCMMPWMGYTPRTLEEIESGYKKCKAAAVYGYKPEISKMLTISSGHISDETAEMLEREPELNALRLSVYTKSADDGENYGWFIYLPSDIHDGVPADLAKCMRIAASNGCNVLCLDGDGPEYPGLETFDW